MSADNIRKRDAAEVENLFDLLATTVPHAVARSREWALHLSGDLNLVPIPSRSALTNAAAETNGRPRHLTMAIGYDAHQDMLEAVRAALRTNSSAEDAEWRIGIDDITQHLVGGPVKDIDLVIRTGGDRRISGFFPWQAAKADFYFVRAPWPSFREVDLARALASHARSRQRGASHEAVADGISPTDQW